MVQRVLLAEDDELLRGQLIDLLTARQFVVESFGDGAAALDFGLNQIFDLAVIDLGLPKLPRLRSRENAASLGSRPTNFDFNGARRLAR